MASESVKSGLWSAGQEAMMVSLNNPGKANLSSSSSPVQTPHEVHLPKGSRKGGG